ncbi:MAG: hypothetical protein JNK82_41840 [Myxococcaceae bacterium]|nr:hypothetical protein [Myxococcaceae bacterium]
MRPVLVALLALTACNKDPAAGFLQTKEQARNYDCTRFSQEEAHERHPGLVPEPPARGGNFGVKDALICRRRLVEWGERNGRDEVILTELKGSVDDIVRLAHSTAPEKTTWYVDAFYPSPQVSQKISVAARVRLAERGQSVSDHVPVLAAGDIAVLARMPPWKSYGIACRRYFDERVLGAGEAFLGIMILDDRESQLHAGVCLSGEWRWLQ